MDCPNASPECKYFESKHGCRTNTHHLYYSKRDYTTPVEREFRELPENKVAMCMSEHDDLHRTERPPLKPDRDFMLNTINTAVNIRRAS